MSEIFGSVWWLIVTLGLLITFHEYGHFVVARRCGVKVLKFSVGFGPALWSRFDRHGTQFVIAAIPLGGYVKMLDTREVDGAVGPAAMVNAFDRKSVGARMAITAAGPVFNLVFTIAALWLMFVIGKPDYQPVVGHAEQLAAQAGFADGDRIVSVNGREVPTWSDAGIALMEAAIDHRDARVAVTDASGASQVRTMALSTLPHDLKQEELGRHIGLSLLQSVGPALVGSVSDSGVAAKAGMKAGDVLVSIDGEAVKDWRDVQDTIARHAVEGKALAIEVRRGDQTVALSAVPKNNVDADGKAGTPPWLLGVVLQAPESKKDATLRFGVLAAVPAAFKETWQQASQTFRLLGSMFSGQASIKNLGGVISIAQAANFSASLGLAWFLNFLAAISLSLAILNLLPIPILDGGGLLYYLIELIKGSPLSERAQIAGQYVGLVLLVALMGLAFYNDILRIAS
jgi:regulator of sigma E protease